MVETLKAFRPLISKELRKMTPEELCVVYKTTGNENCIAAIFEKMFGLAMQIKEKYPLVEDEIAVTACLEKIADLIDTYDPDKNTKFITLFYSGYSRKMHAESAPFKKKKRVCTSTLVSIDDARFSESNSGEDSNNSWQSYIEDVQSSLILEDTHMSISLDMIDFTDTQRKILALLMEGYKKSQILDILNIEPKELNSQIRKIKNKLSENGLGPKEKK